MTAVRLTLTGVAMTGIAWLLTALAPGPATAVGTLRRAQEVADAGGAEAVVLALVGLLAWAAWAWGAIGLLLTAASALPGLPGSTARVVALLLVPERLRTAAALALGLGIAMAGPAAAAPASPLGPPDRPAAVSDPSGPPDWPGQDPPAEAGATPDRHVVVPGDCLWRIAADRLEVSDDSPTDAETAEAVADWWAINADVIGTDPDLIHPGQVLHAPPSDPDPAGGTR
jgi:hypothetical protein